MSDEEPDYMSEDFLKTCTSGGKDVRPGLQHRREVERQHRLEKKRKEAHQLHRERNRPRHQLEAEHREQALDKPIDASNKGFALLQMMGYKPGMAIGKEGSGGIKEPLRPEVKTGRGGLGRQAALQAVQRRKQQIRARAAARRDGATSAEEFRRRIRDKMADRYVTADLMKSQRVCQELDTKMDVTEPSDSWFWPPTPEPEEAEDEEAAEPEPVPFSPAEQLEMLTEYLRKSHLYCVWCGCAFTDEEDLKENCPGPTRDDH